MAKMVTRVAVAACLLLNAFAQADSVLRGGANDDGAPPVAAVEPPVQTAHHEILAISLAAVVIFVAAGGGIGGGGVLDPIYILILGLEPKAAIPLSIITIAGGAVTNFVLNVRKTRRNSTKPVIDYDLILVMQPNLLLGATIGTFVNRLAPSWLLCVLLVALLAVTSSRTLQKALRVSKKERWNFFGKQDETASLLAKGSSSTSASKPVQIPWRKLGSLFGLLVGVMGLNLIAGTAAMPSVVGIRSGSWLHTVVSALPVVFLVVFMHFAYKNIVAEYEQQQRPGHVFTDEEVKWTPSLIKTFPLVSALAGMIAGMFGLGGGIVVGPLLLELGVDPTASSSITATVVLFSSLLVSVQFIVQGAVDYSLASVLLPVGFVMTFLGNVVLFRAVQRFNCPSLIIFSMAIILIVSAIGMTVESVKTLFF